MGAQPPCYETNLKNFGTMQFAPHTRFQLKHFYFAFLCFEYYCLCIFTVGKINFYLIFSMNIFTLPTTEEDAVAFLQDKGIVQASRECRNRHEMKLYFGEQCRWREVAQQKASRNGSSSFEVVLGRIHLEITYWQRKPV